MADTKRAFIETYSRPIPAIYNTVIQELLVQQHFVFNTVNYKYNPVRGPMTVAGAASRECRLSRMAAWASMQMRGPNRAAPPAPAPLRPKQILALGMVSVFDQIMDGYEASELPRIWSAYITCLGQDPAKIRVGARRHRPS